MQLGSLLRSDRRRGPDIWEFRYRDRRHNGRRIYRRIKIGTVKQFKTEAAARKGIAGLVREINFGEIRFRTTTMTVADVAQSYTVSEIEFCKDSQYLQRSVQPRLPLRSV